MPSHHKEHTIETTSTMPVPFPDLDPYATLKLESTATEADIKRAYRRLCLIHHPDKLQGKSESEQEESKREFEKVQFAHMILSDAKKRKSATKVDITEESIAKDKEEYVGSTAEEEDIMDVWRETEGDFLYLFESIPHTEVTEGDEQRLFDVVESLIEDGKIESTDNWEKYKKKRKALFKKFLKSQKSEAKEAEELKKQIARKRKLDTEDDLKQLIQSKQKQSMDDLISRLENKYGAKKTKKAKTGKSEGKKQKAKKSEYDLDDAEFERIQKKMTRK